VNENQNKPENLPATDRATKCSIVYKLERGLRIYSLLSFSRKNVKPAITIAIISVIYFTNNLNFFRI